MTEKQQQKQTLLPVSTEMEASLNTADMTAMGSGAFQVARLTERQEAQCRTHTGFRWRNWGWSGSVSWTSSKTRSRSSVRGPCPMTQEGLGAGCCHRLPSWLGEQPRSPRRLTGLVPPHLLSLTPGHTHCWLPPWCLALEIQKCC